MTLLPEGLKQLGHEALQDAVMIRKLPHQGDGLGRPQRTFAQVPRRCNGEV